MRVAARRSRPAADLFTVLSDCDAASRRRAVLSWAAEQPSIEHVVAGFVATRRALTADGPAPEELIEQLDVLMGDAVRVVSERAVRHALTDPLTGLGTRRSFDSALTGALSSADRAGEPLLIVLADIDGLKQINDTQGHAAGDDLIQRFAQTISRCLRPEDAAYRIGGDELVLLLPGATADAAAAMRERLVAAGAPAASLGWAIYPDETRDPVQLLAIADSRLYSAKRARRRADGAPSRRRSSLLHLAVVAAALLGTAGGVMATVALQARESQVAPAPSATGLHGGGGAPVMAPVRGPVVAPARHTVAGHHHAPATPTTVATPGSAQTHQPRLPAEFPAVPVALPEPPAAPTGSSQPDGVLASTVDAARSLLCTLLCPAAPTDG